MNNIVQEQHIQIKLTMRWLFFKLLKLTKHGVDITEAEAEPRFDNLTPNKRKSLMQKKHVPRAGLEI